MVYKLTQVRVADVVVGDRHRKDLGDIDGLAQSILTVGLIQPIAIDPDRLLLAGHRRVEAWKRLHGEKSKIPAFVMDGPDSRAARLAVERDENIERKAFAPSEAVALADAIEEVERAKAKERQREAGATKASADSAEAGETRKKVADAVGMSHDTLKKAREVVAAATEPTEPTEVQAVAALALQEMDRTGKVGPAAKKVRKARAAAAAGTPEERIEKQSDLIAHSDADTARDKALHPASYEWGFLLAALEAVGRIEVALLNDDEIAAIWTPKVRPAIARAREVLDSLPLIGEAA